MRRVPASAREYTASVCFRLHAPSATAVQGPRSTSATVLGSLPPVSAEKSRDRDIAVNRRARYEFHIEETVEAGLVLLGSEVKALREGKANLKDSYGRFTGDEVYLWNAHISPYGPASQFGHEPTRTRKLLLHREQIARLQGKVQERGLTLIPLRLYFKNGRVKLELALARGKKQHDKREAIKEREVRREIDRAIRHR